MTTNLLTEEQLAEIDMRARIATPPPWLVHHDPRKYVLMPFSSKEDVLRDRDANAAFCANAREDVPRLVAEIRRLNSVLDQVDDVTKRIDAGLDRVQAGELAIIEAYFQRVCARAEATIERTHQVSGAHYAAMQVELAALRQNGPEHE